jgi:dipeptidyl aminopeptidase/acylaminoacyl peptidase
MPGLREYARFVVLWLIPISGLPAVMAADEVVEPFVKRSPFASLALSPDGEHIAAVYDLADRSALVIVRRGDMQPVARFAGEAGSTVARFQWLDSGRVLLEPAERFGELDAPRATGELVLVEVQDARVRKVFHRFDPDDERVLSVEPQTAEVIDLLPDQPGQILVGVRRWTTASPITEVQRLSLDSRRSRTVTRAPVQHAQIVTDPSGEPRLAHGSLDSNIALLYHRRAGDDSWTLINDEAKSGRYEVPLGFDPAGKVAYLQTSREQGPDVVVEWNPADGTRTERVADASYDPGEVLRDGRGAVIGVAFLGPRRRVHFFDESHPDARLQSTLARSFPQDDVYLAPASADAHWRLFEVRSERDPGSVFLFDVKARRAHFLLRRLPAIEPTAMLAAETLRFPARDGLELEAFLTRREGADAAALPLLLIPHGGPFGVFDRPDFDPLVQWLAQSGYAVLQVNYRGSGNRGRAFRSAGAREWGRAMQDDLADAAAWAVTEAIARPGQICLIGASYGAYAALMGVARDSEVFACAIGAFGVYDLPRMAREDRRISTSLGAWSEDWIGPVGALAEVSPVNLAERVRAPVLLIAGTEDPIAPIAHSRRMRAALREAGAEVEDWFVKGAGHGLHREEHRREFLLRVRAFLDAHLPVEPARSSG